MALPRPWAAVFLLLSPCGFSVFAATLRSSTSNLSNSTFSNATDDLILMSKTLLNLTEPLAASNGSLNDKLDLRLPSLGVSFDCYDPPLPRERAWPIKFQDCEMATTAIFGDRERNQKYTFSRGPVATKFFFRLPATSKVNSCVVRLDMNNDSDQDTVRLSIVEATAWVLAHKCSGEEKVVDRYGGRATVSAGTQGLINVWVYGRPWPSPAGATSMTDLVQALPASLIESE